MGIWAGSKISHAKSNPMYAAFTPQQAEQSKKHPDKI